MGLQSGISILKELHDMPSNGMGLGQVHGEIKQVDNGYIIETVNGTFVACTLKKALEILNKNFHRNK